MAGTSPNRAIALLIRELRDLRICAGKPSLLELSRYSENTISVRRTYEYLSRRRSSLPPWRLVAAYVIACHTAAASTGRDCGRLGTVNEWRARWEAASKGDCEAPSPIRAPGSDVATALVDDLDAHASASTSQILQGLDKDLLRLRGSLSAYSGLLIVTNGPRFGAIYEVKHHITTIGRHPGCDIWLNEPTISRRHGEIHRYGDKFTFLDLNSKNGTFRRNIRIRDSLLRSYDELLIGHLRLMFVQGSDGKERFKSQEYDPIRARLIRDSLGDTSVIELLDLSSGSLSLRRVCHQGLRARSGQRDQRLVPVAARASWRRDRRSLAAALITRTRSASWAECSPFTGTESSVDAPALSLPFLPARLSARI